MKSKKKDVHRTFGVEEDPFLIKYIIKSIKNRNQLRNAILVLSSTLYLMQQCKKTGNSKNVLNPPIDDACIMHNQGRIQDINNEEVQIIEGFIFKISSSLHVIH